VVCLRRVCVLRLRLRGDCFVCVCACCVCVACCVVRGVRGVTWLVRVRCVRVRVSMSAGDDSHPFQHTHKLQHHHTHHNH
jgi:hypothetical protein